MILEKPVFLGKNFNNILIGISGYVSKPLDEIDKLFRISNKGYLIEWDFELYEVPTKEDIDNAFSQYETCYKCYLLRLDHESNLTQLLEDTDYKLLPDYPYEEDVLLWIDYRQSLRVMIKNLINFGYEELLNLTYPNKPFEQGYREVFE